MKPTKLAHEYVCYFFTHPMDAFYQREDYHTNWRHTNVYNTLREGIWRRLGRVACSSGVLKQLIKGRVK